MPSSARVDVRGIDKRDDQQRNEVVDHQDGEQEDAKTVSTIAGGECEGAQGEGGVRRGGDAPPADPGMARSDDQVHGYRSADPAQAGEHRHGEPAAIAQLPQVELALGLQPDDEEEQGHQSLVDGAAQIYGERVAGHADGHGLGPERPVAAGPGRVGPDQRGGDRNDEQSRAASLRAEEHPHGCRHAPRPGCVPSPRRLRRPPSARSELQERDRRPAGGRRGGDVLGGRGEPAERITHSFEEVKLV
jgi:hypothetical protein